MSGRKTAMKIWMLVSSDEYELPLAVADTARELAEICGVRENNIISSISHFKAKNHKRCKWVCVHVSDEEF